MKVTLTLHNTSTQPDRQDGAPVTSEMDTLVLEGDHSQVQFCLDALFTSEKAAELRRRFELRTPKPFVFSEETPAGAAAGVTSTSREVRSYQAEL